MEKEGILKEIFFHKLFYLFSFLQNWPAYTTVQVRSDIEPKIGRNLLFRMGIRYSFWPKVVFSGRTEVPDENPTFKPKSHRIRIYVNGGKYKNSYVEFNLQISLKSNWRTHFPPPADNNHAFISSTIYKPKKSLKKGGFLTTNVTTEEEGKKSPQQVKRFLQQIGKIRKNVSQTFRNNFPTLSRRVGHPTFQFLGGLNSSPTLRRCNS